jgi:hypothetical protein
VIRARPLAKPTPEPTAEPTAQPTAERAAPQPTRQQLEMAYRHLARPGWPRTLDAALQVQHYRVCINGLARQLDRPAWRPQPRPLHGVNNNAVVPPTPAHPPPAKRAKPQAGPLPRGGTNLGSFSRIAPAGWLDVKRLAANDRED